MLPLNELFPESNDGIKLLAVLRSASPGAMKQAQRKTSLDEPHDILYLGLCEHGEMMIV
jgi:hypothetical protein